MVMTRVGSSSANCNTATDDSYASAAAAQYSLSVTGAVCGLYYLTGF